MRAAPLILCVVTNPQLLPAWQFSKGGPSYIGGQWVAGVTLMCGQQCVHTSLQMITCIKCNG